jgi:AraC family transcriptional activator of pobA
MPIRQPTEIQRFFLYGEPPRAERGHFLHLETLDARSRPNDWNIRPHAHANLNHVFFIQTGGGEMLVERGQRRYRAPVLLVVPARTIHAFHWNPESAGWVLTLSDTYLEDMFAREAGFRALFEEPDGFEIDVHGTEAALFNFAIERLARELNWTAPGHAAAVDAHLLAVLVEAMRLMQAGRGRSDVAPGPHAAIVARFRAMVEERFRDNEPLDAYAERLGVSTSRLRAACLKIAEQPPARLIQERRLLEARRLLLYSNVTVAEAAYHLGYDDPAYFSRVFTRHVGQSPRDFRKHHPMAA